MRRNETGRYLARVIENGKVRITVTDNSNIWRDITDSCPTIGHWLSGKVNLSDIVVDQCPMLDQKNFERWLAPTDLQPIKAFGVTFIVSLLERLVEEISKGDKLKAEGIRQTIDGELLSSIQNLVPGSDEALALRDHLIDLGQWSPYLEVGLGSDPEIFTKAPPMSALGYQSTAGILRESKWNNSEPEAVLVCNSVENIVGVTIGNDLNLRDIEGRSTLLLGRAKDNRGSTVVGPWIRLFDEQFTLTELAAQTVTLKVTGKDRFSAEESACLGGLTRGFPALIRALFDQHDYPDGVLAFTGSPIAPKWDRDEQGMGFTHHDGDKVTISISKVGTLMHSIDRCDRVSPWRYGLVDLIDDFKDQTTS